MDIKRIKDISIFSELPPQTFQHVVSIMREREFARGEMLFAEGEPGQGLWIIGKGTVRLVKTDLEGREQLLKIVAPYEVFSEVVLFDGGPYPATALAAENGVAIVLYNKDAEELIKRHPNIAWHFLRVLSRRLRIAQERVRILSSADVGQKLSAILLHLSEQQGSLSLSISHQDLASMLGTARETVSRTLGMLANQKLVALGRSKVTIEDKAALEKMASR